MFTNISRKVISIILSYIIAVSCFANSLLVPQSLIPLQSPKGIQLINRNDKSDYFWRLISHFVTQDNLAYCSIASSVIVLNALNIKAPRDPIYVPYTIFTQSNFFTKDVEAILPSILVKKHGATLDQVSKALGLFPVTVQVVHANKLTIEKFRAMLKKIIVSNHNYIIVNFLRTALGEKGGGHLSPLAAYDKKTDRFLLLDVARYKYPPVWIRTQDLWNAINTVDDDAKAYRGFIIVEKS